MEKKTMKAVVWNGKPWFEGLSYDDFPVPEWGGDWVLVRNNVCGICGSDLHFFSGMQDGRFPKEHLPAIFGHEDASTVVAADPQTGFKPGDRVAVEAIHSCLQFGGSCPRCLSGQFHMCKEGMTHIGLPYTRMLPGGYGEYSAVHKDKLHIIPDNVSFDEAALLDILVVNVHAIRIANPQFGDTCCVFGCGVVGLSMIQALHARGIANLIAICKYQYQSELALKCGASHAIIYNDETLSEEMRRLTNGNGCDFVFECVGGKTNAINEAISFTTRQGKIVMMGIFGGTPQVNLNGLFKNEISLVASNSYGMYGYKDEFAISLEMLKHKQVDHNLLISHRFKPEDYVAAIEAARGKDKSRAVKVLFERD